MSQWKILDNGATSYDMLGYLPQIIISGDGPVVEQVNTRYAHGGGWNAFSGFELNREDMSIVYPGDPAYMPIASLRVSETETVYVYPHAWVLIDRGEAAGFEVARLD